MSDVRHIRVEPNDVMVLKGRLAFAHRIKALNQDDTVCRDCITRCVEILHGPVPGADLN